MKKSIFLLLCLGISGPVLSAFNPEKIKNLNDWLFVNPDKGVHTEAIIVTQNNKILYEKYVNGKSETDLDKKYILWSMSKTISSLIFGIAESKGLVNREDYIYKYYKKEIDLLDEKKRAQLKKLKIKHFLEMASGLGWNEFYDADPFNSHVVKMLYVETKKDVVDFIFKTPVKHEPSDHFKYSSGDTNVFMGVLKKVVNKSERDTFPWTWFFDPLKMNAVFEQDASGTFLGSSYVYLSTKDLIKLGYLIMNKGMFEGKQIVPKKYVEYAISLSVALKNPKRCLVDSSMTYGAQIWLNHPCPNGKKPFEDAPGDLIMLRGYGGQSIYIYPSQGIVVARIAKDGYRALDKNKYSKLLTESFK
ncbi:MAG: CubicO group peptidase (beta-lactamase class C family) [Thermoproteota archaeon]|jgi:CubicO group peptidase (beta-lactamase class C family)